MTEEKTDNAPANDPSSAGSQEEPRPAQSGPAFNETPDPLAGAKKAAGDAWKQTEGKTVSMRVYIGSIVAVVILMMLARCGG